MPANRFFVENIGKTLTPEEEHHIKTVMRVRPKDPIELVDGKGHLAKLPFGEAIKNIETHPPTPPLILLQALPKMRKLELIIEKGTELGVTTFYLFPSMRSEIKTLSKNKLDRLRTITIAALKQSGRLYLPEIILSDCVPQVDVPLYHGDPLAQDPLHAKPPCAIAIGPEGGFTPEEMKNLGTPVRLHDNILRCETAAITAIGQIWNT